MVNARLLVLANTIQSAANVEQLTIFVPLQHAAQLRAGSTPPLPASSRALWQPHAINTDRADVLNA